MKLTKRMMAFVAATILVSTSVMAGDGTKENPFTVSELNAQKELLTANAQTVWL